MAEKKRTPTERENDLEKLASLYLKGMRQADIAQKLGVSQPQVSYDLKEIHKRWRESTLVNINEAKHRELARIDNLENEYWRAWERSCEEKTKTKTEKIVGGNATKASVEKDTMLGNPSYLTGVQWCIEQRCKIFGINAPIKADVTSNGETLQLISIVKMPIDEL
jgi:predicted transcriptional regulator